MYKVLCYFMSAILIFGSVDMTAFATQPTGEEGAVSRDKMYDDSVQSMGTEEGICGAKGDNLTWSLNLDTGVLVISGSGRMADYDEGAAPWYDYTKYIKKLNLSDDLTSIGNNAFSFCSSLTGELEFPSGLTTIGGTAFADCSGLTGNLELPSGLTTIETAAFGGCSGLEKSKIYMHSGITQIGNFVFDKSLDITIVCPQGSYAETWAKENGFKIELMGMSVDRKVNYINSACAGIIVVDKATKENIKNAKVSDGVTQYTGEEILEIPLKNEEEQKELTISADEYHQINKRVKLSKGKITYIELVKNNQSETQIELLVVGAWYGDKSYDLQAEKLYLAYIEDVENQSEITEEQLNVRAYAAGTIDKYELIQEEKVIASSKNGEFGLNIILKAGEEKYITPVTTDFIAGAPVYIRVTDSKGQQLTEEIGIKVSKSYLSTETQKQKGQWTLDKGLKVQVPDAIPLLGGGTINVGFKEKLLPIELSIDEDGKVRFALNKELDMDMNVFEQKYKGLSKRASRNIQRSK